MAEEKDGQMSDDMPGFMIPDEPQVMQQITERLQETLQQACAGRYVPMPVALNAAISFAARVTMLAILTAEQERGGGAVFEVEAFKRLMDAAASMEDFRDRKTPWRLQSSSMKAAERAGGRIEVRDISGEKATKQ